MHVFKYSPRKGTIASSMQNQIDGNIKEKRSQKLIQLSDENEKAYNETYIGKEVKVLLEDKEGEFWKGHTSNYMVVKVKDDQKLQANTIQKVKVTSLDGIELVATSI